MAVYSYTPLSALRQQVNTCAADTPLDRERLEGHKFNAPCLYLGDYEAKKDENWNDLVGCFKNKTGHYPLGDLGCLQIPHHGSHHNFRDEFSSQDLLSIIPANLGRDHPSNKVLMEYIKNNAAPYVVTADDETVLELSISL